MKYIVALILASAVVIMILTSILHAEEVGHRCSGLWTGNSCIGTWQRVDKWDTYHGDTYIHDSDRVKQRPERRR